MPLTFSAKLIKTIPRLACLVLLWFAAFGCAQAAKISILLSDTGPEYRMVADAVVMALAAERRAGLDVQIISQHEWVNGDQAKDFSLIVAVGVSAAQSAADSRWRTPVLATLIPRQAFDKILSARTLDGARMTALYLDQPFERQFALMRALLPSAKTFGILLSQQTQGSSAQVRSAAERFQFRPVISTLGSDGELFTQLLPLLPQIDAMFVVPDNGVINRLTIRNFLLATYRSRVPVIGYSQNLVEAGVLSAVFSTPSQIGQHAGEVVRQMLKGAWAAPAYPRYYTLKVNNSVARSLDINVPDEDALLREVHRILDSE